jgi:hypothetical protein
MTISLQREYAASVRAVMASAGESAAVRLPASLVGALPRDDRATKLTAR